MQQPKILFYGSFTAGGTERITFNLASALADSGNYDVCVLNSQPRKPTFPISEKVKYITLKPARRFPHPLVSRISDIRRLISRKQIDVAISIEALTGITLLPAIIGTGVKSICWEHANYYQTQNSRWTKLIRKIWLRQAAAYVVLTQRDRRNFETHEKPRCPIVQIYNPVEAGVAPEYDSNSNRIISVGHLVPIKQFHLIPEIFSKIADKHPDWTWHIYGEGPERPHIESEIAKYNLQDRIILAGASRNIDEAYAKSAVCVLTSRMEGLPTVLIEAQIHHLPCVAFDIQTGPDEIIAHGVNGNLVKAYDTDSMARQINNLIESKEQRISMSNHANLLLHNFNPRSITETWSSLLKSISK